MNDKVSHARQWLRKAESDLTAARRLLDGEGPYDAVCFHAQQAAEKALKSILAFVDAPIPRTHNLEDLQAQCVGSAPIVAGSGLATLELSDLTAFAVEARYDNEFWPERAEAVDAVAKATGVHAMVAAFVEA